MNERPPSLLFRIIVRLTLVSLAMIVIAYGWLYLKVDATAAALRENTLIEQAQQVAEYLTQAKDGSIQLELPANLAEAYNQPDSDYRYAVREENGQMLISSGPGVGPLPIFRRRRHKTYAYDPDGPGPLELFGAAVQVQVGTKSLVVQIEHVASQTEGLTDEVTDEFLTDGGWLGGPLVLTLLAVSIVTIRGTLSPLRMLSQKAAQITPGRTDLRLPESRVPREILPLVHAVNSALDRLDRGFRMQQEFTADAAHELRTPLAVLGAHVDSLADQNVASALRKDVDAMARIVSQLLAVARLEALSVPHGERAELNAIAQEVAANLGRLAIINGKSIALEGTVEPVMVHGEAFALQDALRNLIENALTHTPRGTTVQIRVTDEPAIEVNDAGPGVPVELREKIFSRFWRADRTHVGAGLGLPIVQRTMEAHGGRITVDDAIDGGARFTLHFPHRIRSDAGPDEKAAPLSDSRPTGRVPVLSLTAPKGLKPGTL